jgi:putative tricarboxylic transport membrane protein
VLEQIASRAGSFAPPEGTPARSLPRLPVLGLWPLRGPLARGTLVGIGIGGLVGAGATVSAFVAYGLEKQLSRAPERFGTGHPPGLVVSESANNGSTGGAMAHLLALGIPGSAATAVMMGAFLIHGIQPGPLLFTQKPEQVYTIFAGMILANLLMIALGVAAAACFTQLMRVPAPALNAFIVVFCFIGAFALRNDMADVWLAAIFGVVGFFMRRYDLPIPPMVMGIILGPMAEQYFLTSMVSHANDPTVFVTRPVSAAILALSALIVGWAVVRATRTAQTA